MPQLAPIELVTSAGTEVFTPVNIDKNNVALWRDQSSGIPVGYPSLSHSISEPANNAVSGVYRVKVQLAVPRLNVLTPAGETLATSTVDGVTRAHIELFLPAQSAAADRTQILELVSAAMADSTIVASVVNIEHYY